MSEIKIGCIVLAAGNSVRFGSNKLMAKLGGKTLIQRTLDAIPVEKLTNICVVTQYPIIADLAVAHGFAALKNSHPDLGISKTVSIGISAVSETDAALFMVADQPCLSRESVAKLIDFYLEQPEFIAAAGHCGVRGNPCIFPSRYFSELDKLKGDKGGSVIIERHPNELRILEIISRQLQDVDTPQQLENMRL